MARSLSVAPFALLAGLALSPLALAQEAPPPENSGSPEKPEGSQDSVAQPQSLSKGEVAERYFRGIRRALQKTPRDRWALEAVDLGASPSPAAALAWVVQHTGWVPYEGILRGPKGVLMDRLGNDWDRAWLLAELCQAQGLEVRFVQAAWTAEALDSLRDHWDWGTADHMQEPKHGVLDHFARDAQLSEQAFQVSSESARWRREQAEQETQARVRAVTEALHSALDDESLAHPAPLPWPAVGDAHIWVQVAPGDASEGADSQEQVWVDLDPIHREAMAGQAWLPAEKTFGIEALSAEHFRTIRLTALAESWADGQRQETPLVTVEVRTMDVVGESIEFFATPLTAPAQLSSFESGADWTAKMRQLAQGESEWLPTFVVDDQPHYQLGIRADGSTIENPNQPAAARAAGRAASALSALGSDTSKDEDPYGWTALWIQIEEIGSLGGRSTQPTRRAIFDWVGPAARAAGGPRPKGEVDQLLDRNLRLLGSSALWLSPCDVPQSFLERLFLLRTWQQRELWQSVAEGRDLAAADLQEEMRWVRPLEAPMWGFARARLDWNTQVQSYLSGPNLTMVHQRPVVGQRAPVELESGYDIVWNHREPWPGAPAKLVRLQQGIADTAAEARLLEVWSETGLRSFDLCAQSGPWSVVRDREALSGLPLAWNADVRERMQRDLSAGYWCLVPTLEGEEREASQLAYWRLDPESGTCLGMGGQGWGAATAQEMVETVQLVLFAARAGAAVAKFAQCMSGTTTDAGAGTCAVALLCRASTAIFAMFLPGPMSGVAAASCGLIE